MNRNLALAAVALAAAACTPDFDPASRIEKLRVLAVKAEPPEIDPQGVQTATLESLVVRADFDAEPARTTSVVHVACIPTPGDPTPSPCVQLASLRDPTAVLADASRTACSGGGAAASVAFAGVESCASAKCGPAVVGGTPLPLPEVAVPAGHAALFSALPADAPERILGVQAVVLAFALDATPDDLVEGVGTTCPEGDLAANLARLWASREHVLSTKRVLIRGPQAVDPPNRNPDTPAQAPALRGIRADATDLDPPVKTIRAGTIALTPILAAEAQPEEYWELDAAGQPIVRKQEEWVYSWFSTAGELDELHARGGETDAWTVGPTRAIVAVVVRDLRGGTAWQVREVLVEP